MSLFLASVLVLMGLTSACTYQPRTECYCNNGYINSATECPESNDKCLVSRNTLIRVLRWVISLVSQLEEAGQIAREQEAANMKITQCRTYPRSYSFFPIYYRNNLPHCY